MIGIVTRSTGSWYEVMNHEGFITECRIKGKFRTDNLKHTNPVAVGDKVHYELEPNRETGVIHKIDSRKNYIIRKASNLSKQTHILASNIDQAILVASFLQPATSLGFIDRFLVTCEAYHVPAILIFNKSDLCTGEAHQLASELISLYTNIGYPTIFCSVKTDMNINLIRKLLKDKISLVIGHSGVGKSSLLNKIQPELGLKVNEISTYSGKGKHTTTFAEMLPLEFGGFVIDTPGIREFGIVDMKPEEVSQYFVEIRKYVGLCRFNNCLHLNEPSCAVMDAVENGIISRERYQSYLNILHSEMVSAK